MRSTRSLLLGLALLGLLVPPASASDVGPEVTAWKLNLTGATGSSTDPDVDAVVSQYDADVQRVRHDTTNVYVNTTGVPSYDVGPWEDGNPAVATDRNWLFRISKSPQEQVGTKTATGLGTIGVFVNGVPIYNPKDAMSYLNQGVWNQNAVVAEEDGMDAALGHPSPVMGGGMVGGFVVGAYHHHQRPVSLMAQVGDDGSDHSPILAFAFDGFPVYGPYGYANTDGTGGVVRMESSYRLRSGNRPPGAGNPAGAYSGLYVEDFEYVAGLGDLDTYNGRFAVTPDYPDGIYHYHTTIDAAGESAYPYVVGPQYYGVVATDNITQTVSAPGALGACRNGLDDDADGLPDHPLDLGCDSADDASESDATGSYPCDDGVSNEAGVVINVQNGTATLTDDGLVDLDDPGCGGDPTKAAPSAGSAGGEYPQCQDGADNDGDGKMDVDRGISVYGTAQTAVVDPQCSSFTDNKEKRNLCGLGFELALVLVPLAALRRRGRRSS